MQPARHLPLPRHKLRAKRGPKPKKQRAGAQRRYAIKQPINRHTHTHTGSPHSVCAQVPEAGNLAEALEKTLARAPREREREEAEEAKKKRRKKKMKKKGLALLENFSSPAMIYETARRPSTTPFPLLSLSLSLATCNLNFARASVVSRVRAGRLKIK